MWFIASDVGWLVPKNDKDVWGKEWPAYVSKWEDAWGFKTKAEAEAAAFLVAALVPEAMQKLTLHEIDRWLVTTSTGVTVHGLKWAFGEHLNRLFWSEGMKTWYYGWRNGTKFETVDQAVRARDVAIRTVQGLEQVAIVRTMDDCYGL
jgi:hypothetical protein